MAAKKISDMLKELSDITNKLKSTDTSLEDAIEEFKSAKLLIEQTENELKKVETEINLVLEDNATVKKVNLDDLN